MNIILLGAAGFIGKNLTIDLQRNKKNNLTLVDKSGRFFMDLEKFYLKNVKIKESAFDENTDFDSLLTGQEVVYHLVSTTVPTIANQHIPQELKANVIVTVNMLEACVRCGVKKVVFFHPEVRYMERTRYVLFMKKRRLILSVLMVCRRCQ